MGREKNERHIYTRILADLQSCFLYTMYAGLCSLIANLMPFVFGPISHNFQPGIFDPFSITYRGYGVYEVL